MLEIKENLPVVQSSMPQTLPEHVAYTLGGGLVVPRTVDSPDHAPPVIVQVSGNALGRRRTANGLTAKADAFARWVAHGASLADAYRSAYAYQGTPAETQNKAQAAAKSLRWQAVLRAYEADSRERALQTSIPMADFVKGRLVLEAQRAKSDAGRIAALRLLGQTESLFTTVNRTERTLDPTQLVGLKDKLDQRVKAALARMGVASVSMGRHGQQAEKPQMALSGPHPEGFPLVSEGTPAHSTDTIPLVGSHPFSSLGLPLDGSHTPFSAPGDPSMGPRSPQGEEAQPIREPNRAIIGRDVWFHLQKGL